MADGMRRAWLGRVASAAALVALAGVSWAAEPGPAGPTRIVATTAMIGEPVARIVGDRGRVETLMGEGVDPHLYRPTRSDIARLTRADVILYNGLALEAQLLRPIEQLGARKPVLAIAETIAPDQWRAYDGGPGDPHVWMDPVLWRQALEAAIAFLSQHHPAHAPALRDAAARYFTDLERLDAYAREAMATIPKEARILVTAHDAFSYFGARYDIEVRGILGISTESEAGLKAIEDLVDLIVSRSVKAVFVESSVNEQQIRALIEGAAARGHQVSLGGTLFSDAMGPAGTYEGTYLGMIDHNVTTIVRALGGQAPERGAFGRLLTVSAEPGGPGP